MTLLLTKLIRAFCLMATALLLSAVVASCEWMREDYEEAVDRGETPQYINVTVSVSASHIPVSRATPAGGEYGDGPEKGLDREYEVNNITLIFFQDEAGINTTNDATEVLSVQTYAVHPLGEGDYDGVHTHKEGESEQLQGMEVLYTTGNQQLSGTHLSVGETYNVLVVANAYVTGTDGIQVGQKVKDVRERLQTLPFAGSGVGIDARNFVMSSEGDVTVTLANPQQVTSSASGEKDLFVYYFDCIHIERLAARIDFCTNYQDGTKTAPYGEYSVKVGGETQTVNGFRYDVNDYTYFILESITPFNLYDEQEYLFKHVQANWTDATPLLLADETRTNYVVDPGTSKKVEATMDYVNPLAVSAEPLWNTATRYYRSAENMNNPEVTSKLTIDSRLTGADKSNVFVLAYARENTLLPQSPLKRYATGLVLTGSYYTVADNELIFRKTRYAFLRHQTESANQKQVYPTYEWSELSDDMTSDANTPMNYGVVRNNIYRISINQVSPGGYIELRLAVHDWRNVDNPRIFI